MIGAHFKDVANQTLGNVGEYASALKMPRCIVCLNVLKPPETNGGIQELNPVYSETVASDDAKISRGFLKVVQFRTAQKHCNCFYDIGDRPMRWGESPLVAKHAKFTEEETTYSVAVGVIGGAAEENASMADKIFDAIRLNNIDLRDISLLGK
ncbi:MAG: hypothetical protein K5837_04965 [Candidatus Saccharibacteria bacterium]|nr:hypothetical protein [Candidatus Saccharibacteria bacterium]